MRQLLVATGCFAALAASTCALFAKELNSKQQRVLDQVVAAEVLRSRCPDDGFVKDVEGTNTATERVGLSQEDFATHGDKAWDSFAALIAQPSTSKCAEYYREYGPEGLRLLFKY